MLRRAVLFAVLAVLRSSIVVTAAPVLVLCETTKGPVRMHVYPEWAPLGTERFLDLVRTGFFTQVGLTRVVQGFLVQFGIAADPHVQQQWNARSNIQDDPMIGTLVKRGTLAYAGSGKNSRGTQIWIAFQDSTSLGTQPWETPFGQVVEEDMHVVDSWYSGYGDMAAFGGHGPDQGLQQQQGNAYLKQFPLLDYITSCAIQDEPDADHASGDHLHGEELEEEEGTSAYHAEGGTAEFEVEDLVEGADDEPVEAEAERDAASLGRGDAAPAAHAGLSDHQLHTLLAVAVAAVAMVRVASSSGWFRSRSHAKPLRSV